MLVPVSSLDVKRQANSVTVYEIDINVEILLDLEYVVWQNAPET